MIDKYLILSWKNIGIIIAAWVVSVILHNVVSVVFGFEEALFFIIAIFVIPIFVIISLIYTIYKKIIKK